ncbi:MAG: 4Fe-4S dicluster domain-containing protein [Pyramidobacter sp.]|nr:4Fe-4S dicluster domain-containing protein [Pyramidobacter sp.]
MQRLTTLMRQKAAELIASGTVENVLAWRSGEFFYDTSPALFASESECGDIVYSEFCPANLSKYLIAQSALGKKTAVFLKPCDTYGTNQLIADHRVKRELVHAVGTPCSGMIDINKVRAKGCKGILSVSCDGETVKVETVYGAAEMNKSDVLLDKCAMCKGNEYMICDEELAAKMEVPAFSGDRFAAVKAIEAMTPEERFAFWRAELSKCIRCNTCRDVCPACSCEQCIFDHPEAPVGGKAAADDAEENLFHIIRAYHVAGRCVGCGECARVCPQGVKLGLLNMKFMKDINEFFGAWQAGKGTEEKPPLVTYAQGDLDPNDANTCEHHR